MIPDVVDEFDGQDVYLFLLIGVVTFFCYIGQGN